MNTTDTFQAGSIQTPLAEVGYLLREILPGVTLNSGVLVLKRGSLKEKVPLQLVPDSNGRTWRMNHRLFDLRIGIAETDYGNKIDWELSAKSSFELSHASGLSLRIRTGKTVPYAFIGGMRYVIRSDSFTIAEDTELLTPKYLRFHLNSPICDGFQYRSAIYSKNPIAVFSMNGGIVLLHFHPLDGSRIHSIIMQKKADEELTTFCLGFCGEHTLTRRKSFFFGKDAEKGKMPLSLKAGETLNSELEISFHESPWTEVVFDDFFASIPENDELSEDQIASAVQRGIDWLPRVWDDIGGVFLEQPAKEKIGQQWGHFSLTGFNALRLPTFLRLYQKTGYPRLKEWLDRLEEFLIGDPLIREIEDKGIIWLNSVSSDGKKPFGYVTAGTGYGGYPGGMGFIVRGLFDYIGLKREAGEEISPKLFNRAIQGARWILNTQEEDGHFPYTHAYFKNAVRPYTVEHGSDTITIGGGFEAALALFATHRETGDIEFKTAALNALEYLNPKNSHQGLRGFGYLRDAVMSETEGISALPGILANVSAYELTNDEKYKKAALHWAAYASTFHYLWDNTQLDVIGCFDPCVQSFTPRLSVNETLQAAVSYQTLARITGDERWKRFARYLLSRALPYIENSGGASETHYFDLTDGLYPIPFYCTFTLELFFHAVLDIVPQAIPKYRKVRLFTIGKLLPLRFEDDTLFTGDRPVLELQKGRLSNFRDSKGNIRFAGIDFLFAENYSIFGFPAEVAFKMGMRILKYDPRVSFLSGVIGGRVPQGPRRWNLFSRRAKHLCAELDEAGESLTITGKSKYHEIDLSIKIFEGENILVYQFNPLRIKVLREWLPSTRYVAAPVIMPVNAQIIDFQSDGDRARFSTPSGNVLLESDSPNLIWRQSSSGEIEADISLCTAWEAGGLYEGVFNIILENIQ